MKIDWKEAAQLPIQMLLDSGIVLKDKCVLDIGCGSGEMVRQIAHNYNTKKIIGIDVKQVGQVGGGV